MFSAKRIFPLLLLVAPICAAPQTQAQTSVPLYTIKYCVQVEWYFWRSGGSYWATEYETSDLGEAQLVLELFEAALESGALCDILGCNVTTWIPVDVRLKTRYEWNINPVVTPYATATKWYYLRP